MMGLYFAATGFGNKVAGIVGEASQGEPTHVALTTSEVKLATYIKDVDQLLDKGENFDINTAIYPVDGQITAVDVHNGKSIMDLVQFKSRQREEEILKLLKKKHITKQDPYHATFKFRRDADAKESVTNGKVNYSGVFIIEEVQTKLEFRTFVGITIFTVIFGILVILIIKPLKRLTHGVEDDEH